MRRHIIERLLVLCFGLCVAQTALCAAGLTVEPTPLCYWKPLAQDGLHDPARPWQRLLQNPAEALSQLPFDGVGNQVKWISALREGYIAPRNNIYPETKIQFLDLDIMLTKVNTGELPRVLFPHKPHTEWLDCSNCHEWMFKSKAGATPITMLANLEGEYCGRCHGAVAFPLTECYRCHSVPFNAKLPPKTVIVKTPAAANVPATMKLPAKTK